MAVPTSTQTLEDGTTLAVYNSPSGGPLTLKIGTGTNMFASMSDANSFVDRLQASEISSIPAGADSVNLAALSSLAEQNPDLFAQLTQLLGQSGGSTLQPNAGGGLGREMPDPGPDHRVRLRAKPGMEDEVYGSGPLAILSQTNGMVFPYTPNISWAQTVNYSPLNLVHVNQDFHYYGSTPNLTLNISGRFTAQNNEQAVYCFACIHFLRTISKMRFGVSDQKRGLPPPMLVLDGYGDNMFNQIPVIVNSYDIQLVNEVDYVPASVSSGTAWVPSDFTIGVSITVQNTPAAWRDQFNLDSFRNGSMLGSTKGWI